MQLIPIILVLMFVLTGCYDKSISSNCGQGYKVAGCDEQVTIYNHEDGQGSIK